jgi:hypothetical protein
VAGVLAITAAFTRASLGGPAPSADGVRMVIAEMQELSSALRETRRPEELPLPDESALAGVVAELRTAHAVLAGPVGHGPARVG